MKGCNIEKKSIGVIAFILTLALLALFVLKVDSRKGFFERVDLPVYRYENCFINDTTLSTYKYSYYSYNNGTYETKPGFYEEKRYFTMDNTAIFIIDPWSDMPFPEVNDLIKKHSDKYIVPLIDGFVKKGGTVYIFTTNPDDLDYDTEIVESLKSYVSDYNNVQLIYYSNDMVDKIVSQLKKEGKNNIVYTGYATEMCVLFRPIGIMAMNYSEYSDNFDFYIIPEATMSMVSERNSDNISMSNDICIMLAQQDKANIIVSDDFLRWIDKYNEK